MACKFANALNNRHILACSGEKGNILMKNTSGEIGKSSGNNNPDFSHLHSSQGLNNYVQLMFLSVSLTVVRNVTFYLSVLSTFTYNCFLK